jgi:hypothetical protein
LPGIAVLFGMNVWIRCMEASDASTWIAEAIRAERREFVSDLAQTCNLPLATFDIERIIPCGSVAYTGSA